MTREEYDNLCSSPAGNIYPGHEGMAYQWFMQQHGEEFWDLLEELNRINAKVVLEIGSAHGGTLPFFDHLVGPGGLVIGIELQPFKAFTAVRPPYSGYQPVGRLETIIGDSRDPETYAAVSTALGNRSVDSLFIDGDHSYEGTRNDFLMYKALVRPGGIIGFHDVAIEPPVQKVYDEVTEYSKKILPIHYMGIGIVYA